MSKTATKAGLRPLPDLSRATELFGEPVDALGRPAEKRIVPGSSLYVVLYQTNRVASGEEEEGVIASFGLNDARAQMNALPTLPTRAEWYCVHHQHTPGGTGALEVMAIHANGGERMPQDEIGEALTQRVLRASGAVVAPPPRWGGEPSW